MKKEEKNIIVLTFLSFIFYLFFSCSNSFEQPHQSASVEEYGKVSINFADKQERTILPVIAYDNYVYTFTKSGEWGATPLELIPDINGLFSLELGVWQVDVKAYIGEAIPANLAATGTSNVTVSSGPTIEVTVALEGIVTDDGYGTFTYTVQYPATTDIEISLQKLTGLIVNVDLNPDSEETTNDITVITKTAENVPTGFYLLTVLVNKGALHTGISEAVHIYPLLTTTYEAEFDEDDLIPTVVNIAAIQGITSFDGETPTTVITETEQYTGTVTWDPSHATFVTDTEYTATIILTEKEGYTLKDVPANFFTIAGATSVSNAAGSGEITATFTTPNNLSVTNATEWDTALSTISSGGNNKRYVITVNGSFGITGTVNSFGSATGITVTLTGNGKMHLTGQGRLIYIGNNQTLIIDGADLILEGLKNGQNGSTQDNYTSLVYVNGTNAQLELKNGTICNNAYNVTSNTSSICGGGVYVSGGSFIMSGGEISGNTISATSFSTSTAFSGGGGVYIYSGSFTMNGGKISDNSSRIYFSNEIYTGSGGGGVLITRDSSSFTMNGGVISGNTALTTNTSGNHTARGGGVYVEFYSINFTMNGGEISGNTVSSTSNAYGGGVYFSSRGSFTMNGGKISGNTAKTTNTTSNTSALEGAFGGGVCMDGQLQTNLQVIAGRFTMRGGEISGNTCTSHYSATGSGVALRNGIFRIVTGTIDGMLYRSSSSDVRAERGAFSGETWNVLGVFTSGNGWFKVLNGEIVQ